MAYKDKFRISVHAVITDRAGKLLLLKMTYADKHWSLPGGAIERGENIYEALERECKEELGVKPKILYLSGVNYHKKHDSFAFIFRCTLPAKAKIRISPEHSDFQYFDLKSREVSPIQRDRVKDCISFKGKVISKVY
jgi:8-oxo-dGTP pyrophosphatase MutT (NUDIX family)